MATERIRRALELARAQRSGRNAHVAPLMMPQEVPAGSDTAEPTGRYLRTPVLPVTEEQLRRNRVLRASMDPAAAESFGLLRTQVLQRMRPRGWNSLGIVSAASGDGKSTVALNLAIAIARDANHNALLVDLDLRNPSLRRMLDLDVTSGVEGVLAGTQDVETALVRLEGYERLLLLPACNPVVQSSELLSAPTAQALAAQLKNRYPDRIVLYDLPPLLGTDDALAFLPSMDAVLLVVAEGQTRKHQLQHAMELLKDKPIVGTVLNRSLSASQEYYPYYAKGRG